jgi:hypothetical protein
MINLQSITRGAQIKAPRIVLLGVEKIGKSTFAAGADKPIVLPIRQEEGVDALDIAKFPTLQSFAEVRDALSSLANEKHDYKTVIIDSASALEPLIFSDVCESEKAASIEKVGGGYGKGYTEALSRWRELMQALDFLRESKNMASVIIGHVKVKKFDDPLNESYDQFQFDVNDKASATLFRWADFIGFANTKTFVKKEQAGFGAEKGRAIDASGGQRFLFCQKSPAFPAGGRGPYGKLPDDIPLNWSDFKEAVISASK